MRTLVLSVCVGLCLSACDGAVEKSEDDVEARDGGGSDHRDSSASSDDDSGSEPQEPSDGGTTSEPDSGNAMPATDGGTRDAGASDAGTRDAGRDSGPGAQDSGPGNPPDSGVVPTGKPVFVVAGYQSGIAMSTDLGRSWRIVRDPNHPYADNEWVLSGCAFGNGTFVVAGWDLFSSPDGVTWTERTSSSTQWLGNMTFGNNRFVGTGGYGTAIWSETGTTWQGGNAKVGTSTSGFDTTAFGNGVFMTTSKGTVLSPAEQATYGTDPKRWEQWWRSTDGATWTKEGDRGHSDRIVWCDDHFSDAASCTTQVANGQTVFGANTWLRVRNQKSVERLDNGQWVGVNVPFNANCIAFGYVP